MYPEYFGLKEPSFSITPDPHYLYLSREHREALAHLLYGAGEGGGFVLLTGEVGTGKTTICRAFLEQLPQQVDVALILNPAVTVPELLHSICQEFGVKVPGHVTSSKVLVDELNRFLLIAHAKRRRPVLMIDEAQNLRPEVLEQIRLLTNLETHRHKLLQIFLVGQPELRDLLEQKELRQLAQRITARYHLLPLSAKETKEYVRHRLAVAGVERRLFTPSALRRISHLSGGIPRLINILCDRSLLGAFATHRHIVDTRIVNKAAQELTGQRQHTGWQRPLRMTFLLLILFTSAGWLAYTWKDQRLVAGNTAETALETPPPPPLSAPAMTEAGPSPSAVESMPAPGVEPASEMESGPDAHPEHAPESASEQEIRQDIQAPLDTEITEEETQQQEVIAPIFNLEQLTMERKPALALLLARWGSVYSGQEQEEPCRFAERKDLRCRQGNGGWNKLYAYNRPALILLTDGTAGVDRYAVVEGLDTNHALLNLGATRVKVPLTQLDPYWSGDFLLIWQPPLANTSVIGPRASGDSVRWLRETLSSLPGWVDANTDSNRFDQELKQAVQRFQRHRGLVPDGIVGPETLIHLNTAIGVPGTPHLENLR